MPSSLLAVSGSECFGLVILHTASLFLTICARRTFLCCPACLRGRRTCWSRRGLTAYHAFRLPLEGCQVPSQTNMTLCSSLRRTRTRWPERSIESFEMVNFGGH